MKSVLVSTTALAGLCFAVPALAQTGADTVASTPAAKAAATGNADGGQGAQDMPGDIIVTGSALPQRRFDVSYAINSLSQADIKKLAPLNFADMLGQVPGIQAEATGGDVQNITRVRGIPNDDGLLVVQQDGLVLFPEDNGMFWRGDSLERVDLMTKRVEVVRGGPAPIFASEAAAIVNAITVTGTQTPKGEAQVTLGDIGLYRLDLMQSGPIDANTTYAIGGFLRQSDGYRDNGFPNDRGGQVRANILHTFSNGTLKITGNYLNDRNVFYLPIPVADPRDPSVSLNPYLNYFSGTLNSPDLRDVTIKYLDNGVLKSENRDLANGRHTRYANIGLRYNADFDGWKVSVKGGYTSGHVSFDAFYSTTNPVDADAFAASYLTAARTAFGANVSRLGYAYAGTSGASAYNPDADSGLVMQGQYRAVDTRFHAFIGDGSLTRDFDTGLGSHSLTVGLFGSLYNQSYTSAYQNYLIQVKGKPATLDLVAYHADGSVAGYVTDNGALNDTTTLNHGKVDAGVIAFYANDTWQITRALRMDGGIRHDINTFDGWAALTTAVDLGNAATLADDKTRAFTGAVQKHHYNAGTTNWTVGLNYDLSSAFGAYLRASHLEVAPSSLSAASVNPTVVVTKANQYEAGLKFSSGPANLYLTGFYTRFNPLNASFTAYNPVTGQNDVTVPFIGKADIKGIEADGSVRFGGFSLAGSLTVQDPKYAGLRNVDGADGSRVNGNQMVREPKIFGNVRPSYDFILGADTQLQVYGRYNYTGQRYVDYYNTTRLPAYGTLGLGIMLTHGTWQAQVVGDNITNAHGLTEGNPRTDILSGQGNSDAIYGRPLFGRNFRLVVSKSW